MRRKVPALPPLAVRAGPPQRRTDSCTCGRGKSSQHRGNAAKDREMGAVAHKKHHTCNVQTCLSPRRSPCPRAQPASHSCSCASPEPTRLRNLRFRGRGGQTARRVAIPHCNPWAESEHAECDTAVGSFDHRRFFGLFCYAGEAAVGRAHVVKVVRLRGKANGRAER